MTAYMLLIPPEKQSNTYRDNHLEVIIQETKKSESQKY